jgi:hypothetical protein
VTLVATDADGDPVTYSIVSAPNHGTLAGSSANRTYTPASNYNGPDSFTFRASDGVNDSNVATVSVTVDPVNDPPVASPNSALLAEDSFALVPLPATDVDGDPLTYSIVSPTAHGVLSGSGANRTYTPDANYNGADSFTFKANDGTADSNTATVSLIVLPVNDAPVAVNDSATTAQGAPVTITVLANDTDIDGPALSIAAVSDPPHGTAVANGNGTITYTPDAAYSGPDAFAYTASDGAATSNLATVSITVTPAPPANPFHIGDLDGTASVSGKTWTAKVTLRVHNATHGNVPSVVVTVTWSGGGTGSAACTTATNGTCTVQLTKLSRASATNVTFTVISAVRSGWAYVPGANHDIDGTGDSNGTVITIAHP